MSPLPRHIPSSPLMARRFHFLESCSGCSMPGDQSEYMGHRLWKEEAYSLHPDSDRDPRYSLKHPPIAHAPDVKYAHSKNSFKASS